MEVVNRRKWSNEGIKEVFVGKCHKTVVHQENINKNKNNES